MSSTVRGLVPTQTSCGAIPRSTPPHEYFGCKISRSLSLRRLWQRSTISGFLVFNAATPHHCRTNTSRRLLLPYNGIRKSGQTIIIIIIIILPFIHKIVCTFIMCVYGCVYVVCTTSFLRALVEKSRVSFFLRGSPALQMCTEAN